MTTTRKTKLKNVITNAERRNKFNEVCISLSKLTIMAGLHVHCRLIYLVLYGGDEEIEDESIFKEVSNRLFEDDFYTVRSSYRGTFEQFTH